MLIIEPCAGLGNRILALATAYQAAKDMGHRAVLLWDIDGAVGIPVEGLFELPGDIRIITTTKLPYRQKPVLRGKSEIIRFLSRNLTDKFIDCCDVERMRREEAADTVRDYLDRYHRIYLKSFCEIEEIRDNRIFRIFRPSQAILKYGGAIFKRITEKTAGVHIRRTDHAEAIKNSPVELFIDKIREVLESGDMETVFLATDDEQVERLLLGLFGDRIIFNPAKKFSRSDEKGMKDSLVDMLALSKCRRIYGSYGSTFSRIAAYLGDRELVILRRGSEEKSGAFGEYHTSRL